MSTFARVFPIDGLTDQGLAENPWFKDMLFYWRPAGDANHYDLTRENPKRLRLAIRGGYLNLYRGGQSVARIEIVPGLGLQARIHNKYVYGDSGRGNVYVTVTSEGIPDQQTGQRRKYRSPADLDCWISNANKHGHKEKQFIDLVVACNPDTIDLEMALPAYLPDHKERKAPRMDLVALESLGNGKGWQVVFWEAKLVTNGEARCQGESKKPNVVAQLREYTEWLEYGNHEILMAQECKRTCEILVALHRAAKRIRPDIEELGIGIQEVAKPRAAIPLIDKKPRLLIDNRTGNAAFMKNGHLDKLRNTGFHVQMVQNDDQMILETHI
jgi:hypothetical protein